MTCDTPEEDVAALVDAVRRDPARRDVLVALLPERNPVYTGRSANAVVRLRGYLIAAFEQIGLPAEALPYVLDELQNGRDAYLVAAAARALRGSVRPPDGAVGSLLRALENIRDVDDAVTFERYRPNWPVQYRTTATEEVRRTLEWARRAGKCCAGASSEVDLRSSGDRVELSGGARPGHVELQDQDGRLLTFDDFFLGRVAVVTFFYTRCENPNKCSLTVSSLAKFQHAAHAAGIDERVRTAAITYDPGYDNPPRLLAYGQSRGVRFTDGNRLLRTTAGLAELTDYFQLGVNYGPGLVNRHRIELFVLDVAGAVRVAFTRLAWDPLDVLAEVTVLLGRGSRPSG